MKDWDVPLEFAVAAAGKAAENPLVQKILFRLFQEMFVILSHKLHIVGLIFFVFFFPGDLSLKLSAPPKDFVLFGHRRVPPFPSLGGGRRPTAGPGDPHGLRPGRGTAAGAATATVETVEMQRLVATGGLGRV